jgi:predicted transcriptional regulator of viral defense system
MQKTISIEEAASLWVIGLDRKTAFFDSKLYEFLHYIRETRSFQNQNIKGFRTDSNLKKKLSEVTDYLVSSGLVQKPYDNYFVIANKDPSDLEIVCSLYNIGYITYLSAMRFYNLTNRIPKRIDYIAPTRPLWKKTQSQLLSENRIDGENLEKNNVFIPPYPSERIKIKGKYLNVHSRSHLYPHMNKGESIRIISIGDLFLEMVRNPDLCGGFQHVLEVYEEMAEVLLNEIIDSVELYGNAIDKSRIGFILNSHLDIQDPIIDEWKAYSTARGGSRKMISNEPYSDSYSEDWCISLNHSVFN